MCLSEVVEVFEIEKTSTKLFLSELNNKDLKTIYPGGFDCCSF